MFAESWHYHPMGLFVLILFLLTATQVFLPHSVRERLERYMQARAIVFNALYLAFVVAFVSFGAARGFLHFGGAWLDAR